MAARDIRAWFAPEDLKIGERFRPRIDESIRIFDKLVVILSSHSTESAWVEREIEEALERERQQQSDVLFPIRLDDSVLTSDSAWAADIRRSRHVGDFREWKDHDKYLRALERLVRDLRKK